MADNKKLVAEITSMDDDFTQWYTDVCIKSGFNCVFSYQGIYGIKPYGYAIWENIMKLLDERFKKTGVQNVSMPLLIPRAFLRRKASL
jgi:prolyl-tRNA synthetase